MTGGPVLALAVLQALGALIGAGSAVWAEIAYVRALRDGELSNAETLHLRRFGIGLRFGLLLVLLSSFALVVVAYLKGSSTQPALTASYWILIGLSVLILYVSNGLARKRFPFALGSALLFTAWWFLAYLTLGLLPGLSFGAAVALYAVATGVFYAVLTYARMLTTPPSSPRIS